MAEPRSARCSGQTTSPPRPPAPPDKPSTPPRPSSAGRNRSTQTRPSRLPRHTSPPPEPPARRPGACRSRRTCNTSPSPCGSPTTRWCSASSGLTRGPLPEPPPPPSWSASRAKERGEPSVAHNARRTSGGRPRRVLTGLGAAAVLVTLLLGLPYLLVVVAGNPLHGLPASGELWSAITTRDDGQLFLRALALVAWVALAVAGWYWLTFAVAVLVEIPAQIRGRRTVRIPGMRLQQRLASALVAAVASAVLNPSLSTAMTATVVAPAVVVVQQHPAATAPAGPGLVAARHASDHLTHPVQRGESLVGLSERYGIPIADLASANYGITQPDGRALLPGHTHLPWLDAAHPNHRRRSEPCRAHRRTYPHRKAGVPGGPRRLAVAHRRSLPRRPRTLHRDRRPQPRPRTPRPPIPRPHRGNVARGAARRRPRPRPARPRRRPARHPHPPRSPTRRRPARHRTGRARPTRQRSTTRRWRPNPHPRPTHDPDPLPPRERPPP